jgi:hypothetical protein
MVEVTAIDIDETTSHHEYAELTRTRLVRHCACVPEPHAARQHRFA